MLTEKIKNIIINRLNKELSELTFILFEDSVWLVDVEKKYWVIEYRPEGLLIYRHDFFNEFFSLFSLYRPEFELIICEVFENLPISKKIERFSPITDIMTGIHTWNGLIKYMLSDGVVLT